jgi:hypothetical protein
VSNAQTVYEHLVGLGLPPGAATGVIGNLVAESGVNPRAVQPKGPGRGIVQWSLGGRWNQLLAWARGKSADPWALATQEAFMVAEMKSMGVWDQLKTINDPTTAAALVMRKYEMPADQTDANARKRANLGIEAVEGKSLVGKVSDGVSKLLPWNLPGTIGDAAGSAAESAGAGIIEKVKPLAFELAFIGLGLGLVALGVNKTFRIRERANAMGATVAKAVI